jgi:hypothetical protein
MTGDSDTDADGQTDIAEFTAGTCPTNAQSRFELRAQLHNAGSLEFQWPSRTNRVYVIQWAETPVHQWQSLATQIIACPPQNSFTAVPPGAARGCLQIQVSHPGF